MRDVPEPRSRPNTRDEPISLAPGAEPTAPAPGAELEPATVVRVCASLTWSRTSGWSRYARPVVVVGVAVEGAIPNFRSSRVRMAEKRRAQKVGVRVRVRARDWGFGFPRDVVFTSF